MQRSTILITAAALAACSPAANSVSASNDMEADPLPILTRSSMQWDVVLQALFRGTLHLDPRGCIRAGDDSGPLIVWHPDSRIEQTDDGRFRVTDGYTGHSAYLGAEVAMGGGVGSAMPTNLVEPVPEACRSEEYWVTAHLMSEDDRQALLERERNRKPVPSPE